MLPGSVVGSAGVGIWIRRANIAFGIQMRCESEFSRGRRELVRRRLRRFRGVCGER